ncbi:MAG: hypothetical protein V3V00_06425 [Saprospiraceae bacterium]
MKIGLPELILIQFIIYMGLFLMSSYIGLLICLVMAPIFFFVLIISMLAEVFDRSPVSRSYYTFMASGAIIPLIVLFIGVTMDPHALDWLNE